MTHIKTKPMREQVEEYIKDLQDRIVSSFETLDPNAPAFKRDSWIRAQGGSGRSYVFSSPPSQNSIDPNDTTTATILEKAGVNISIVHGILPPPAIKQMRADHTSV